MVTQADAFGAIAAQRARALVQDVKQGLQQAPRVESARVLNHWRTEEDYGGRKLERADVYHCVGGVHVTRIRTTDPSGQVLKHSLERYHEARTEAGDHSDLLVMSHRHIPSVVSRLCGFLGAIGLNFQPQDSVLYKHQTDRWDGIDPCSHREVEQVRVYDDGVLYERRGDNEHIHMFLPGLTVD